MEQYDREFKLIPRFDPDMMAKSFQTIAKTVKKLAGDRDIVVRGTGDYEKIFEILDLRKYLDIALYVSKDAQTDTHRGLPVKSLENANLSPQEHYICVLVSQVYPEIRTELCSNNFQKDTDYWDILESPPIEFEQACALCGGNQFIMRSFFDCKCMSCMLPSRTKCFQSLLSEHLKMDFSKIKFLCVSPSSAELKILKDRGATDITSVDIRPMAHIDIVADLCNMIQVDSESYDIVLACGVLNYVYDDIAALNEINRVLRGGWFIVYTALSDVPASVTYKNPLDFPGYSKDVYEQYNIGCFRTYGQADYHKLLQSHFSSVHYYDLLDDISGVYCRWYICKKERTDK